MFHFLYIPHSKPLSLPVVLCGNLIVNVFIFLFLRFTNHESRITVFLLSTFFTLLLFLLLSYLALLFILLLPCLSAPVSCKEKLFPPHSTFFPQCCYYECDPHAPFRCDNLVVIVFPHDSRITNHGLFMTSAFSIPCLTLLIFYREKPFFHDSRFTIHDSRSFYDFRISYTLSNGTSIIAKLRTPLNSNHKI